MQEASDPTTGMGDSIELEPMIVTSYEYDTLEFFFSDITNGNSPFDAGSIDPETGMVCHTISNSGFDPIDYCVPGHFDSNFIYNIKNNPCYDSSGLYTEATQFEIVFRKEVSDTIHRKRARYNTTYHGALIAVMEYYNPTMARNQTNMLKWHKVYFGSTDDDSLRRYVKVEALQDQKAPSLIWNYLNDEDYAETDVTYDDKGNVIEVIGPVNDDGQRLRVQYDYDTEVEQYVTHINNLSYGEERCMIYDYETGNLMEEKDVNGHSIAYRYDDKSRLVSVFGPREFEDPSSAPTMSFAYFPEGTVSGNGVPVAFTYHNMDVAEEPSGEGQGDLEGGCSEPADLDGRPEITTAMQTSTFMDGMQRGNKDNHLLVGQLEIIMESGERLLNTINSILSMAKIEANKMEVDYEETNINDFLSHLLIPLKTLAMKKNLLLTARFATKPFVARVDKRYFEMIVNNIVGNAIKYSDEGLIKVLLKQVDDKIHFEVKDSGIGMSEEFVQKLYAPFEQESVGYDRQFEGTGLGLSITKNLVEILNGTIEIKSKKNAGTTVLVILPVN